MSDDRLAYLWYGDDFTGASDTLATFAKMGLRAILSLGVPTPERLAAIGPLDALGIAGAARSLAPEAMRAELEPIARFVAGMQPHVLHYKCCSTFDSAPEVGSIGVASRLFRAHVQAARLFIVGGQPSLQRYCGFGNLFAAAGEGGEVFRIDRHPTMANHPTTPMHEADLRRHLAAQDLAPIGLIDWRMLAAASDAALAERVAGSGDIILFDVLNQAHLVRIGARLWAASDEGQTAMAIGASSVAEAVIAHWQASGRIPDHVQQLSSAGTGSLALVAAATGPVFVLAGSQSPVTARQIEFALAGGAGATFTAVAIDVDAIVAHADALIACAETCAGHLAAGQSVIARTGTLRAGGPSQRAVAEAGGRLVAAVADRVPALRRIGVAGGDTSSLAMAALDPWALSFAGTLGAGVTLVRAHADNPARNGLELMLKGGQMGPPDLFLRLRDGTAT